MIHFLRLTRPLNLFIIAVTMYGVGAYVESLYSIEISDGIDSFPFFILVFSTVLIAAAGNVINDYFDLQADRINKPEKVVLGKYLKRRMAIVAHWAINFIAFAMSIYLSWYFHTFWYVFIHVLSINILWAYSSYFKRTLVIGNVLIASLTGLVPLLVGIYYTHLSFPSKEYTSFPIEWNIDASYPFWLIILLSVFAFTLNFAREIVKDMEDVEGDLIIKAKTIPIVAGIQTAKFWAFVLLLVALAGIIASLLLLSFTDVRAQFTLILSALFLFVSLGLTVKASQKKDFKRINTMIKLAIILGTLSPLIWSIIYTNG